MNNHITAIALTSTLRLLKVARNARETDKKLSDAFTRSRGGTGELPGSAPLDPASLAATLAQGGPATSV